VHVPNKKLDRAFFAGMIVLLWGAVLFGFAKTYFMAGMVAAPLPDKLIHVHGAVFTLWMVLLLVQSVLVVSGKIRVHRTLGMVGFGLAVLMVGLGVTAGIDQLRRGHAPPGLPPEVFLVVPLSGILLFAVTVFFAYRFRNKPELHKRLILIATIGISEAGIARWPIDVIQQHPPVGELVILALLLMVMAFDVVSLKRVSKATIWAGGALVLLHLVRIPIAQTGAWLAFARMLKG
jgi:hypothetical protein